jgi:hypothetical protein
MADEILTRTRYVEAFWRAHHEAWRCSELNQREYCEAQGIPLKAFGNWRAKFKAEPQLPERKLLYRRGGLSHTLSHSLSHTLSHVTYPSWLKGPVVPPARDGHRRRFSEADKRRILEEAAEPNASLAKIARFGAFYADGSKALLFHHGGGATAHRHHRNPAEAWRRWPGERSKLVRVRCPSAHAPLRSRESRVPLLPAGHVNRNADQGAAPARPRTRAAREPAPWW